MGGGLGLARLGDGMVVMVPYVLPGEEVVVQITKRKKNYLEAKPLEILKSSDHRVDAPCPHFAVCGGCDLQHADYSYQLELKEAILREQLVGAKVVSDPDNEDIIKKAISSPDELGYRQRVRLQVDKAGEYGFFRNRSHEVEQIERCLLARPEINRFLEKVSDSRAMGHLLALAEELEVLVSPGDQTLVLIVHLRRKPRPADVKAAHGVADEFENIKAVYLAAKGVQTQGPYCGLSDDSEDEDRTLMLVMPFPAFARHDINSYDLCQEAGGFSQVNLEQNNNLIATMLDWVGELSVKRGLDLFCGMGNFTIPLAAKLQEVVGLDLQRAAIRSADRNAEAAGIDNCTFRQKTAVDAIREIAVAGEKFDLVLLDPPRRGCREVIPHLAELGNPAVIYVSCDPATLARDISDMKTLGYELQKVQPFDMFPQTHHQETMALLIKP